MAVNHDTLATIGVVIAAVALGFVFGIEYTGRLATAWLRSETAMLAAGDVPGFVGQAKQLRLVAVAVFAVGAVGATAAWVRGEDAE